MLYEKLASGTVSWGVKVIDLKPSPDNGGVQIKLESGNTMRANLVVGADGIRSKIRATMIGDDLHYLGVFIILGISPVRHSLIEGGGEANTHSDLNSVVFLWKMYLLILFPFFIISRTSGPQVSTPWMVFTDYIPCLSAKHTPCGNCLLRRMK